uniref:Uncharacterized protein n=1 Tax=Romanomermis culicivorax TaxID=13658 RepID=A0A915IRQ2_ROMCU
MEKRLDEIRWKLKPAWKFNLVDMNMDNYYEDAPATPIRAYNIAFYNIEIQKNLRVGIIDIRIQDKMPNAFISFIHAHRDVCEKMFDIFRQMARRSRLTIDSCTRMRLLSPKTLEYLGVLLECGKRHPWPRHKCF